MKSMKIKREKERKKKKNERKTDNALLLYNAEMRQKSIFPPRPEVTNLLSNSP